jgi:phosphatase NudJ
MPRSAIPTWFFVLVVVRRGDRFLVVKEQKHGGGWYLPAGRVEAGESLEHGAIRETLEESGLEVEIDGILRIEHTPAPTGARVRLVLVATPIDDRPPRSTPNEHTDEARFVTLVELAHLRLRGVEVEDIFTAVAAGAPVYPMRLVTVEGAPWR